MTQALVETPYSVQFVAVRDCSESQRLLMSLGDSKPLTALVHRVGHQVGHGAHPAPTSVVPEPASRPLLRPLLWPPYQEWTAVRQFPVCRAAVPPGRESAQMEGEVGPWSHTARLVGKR